VATLVKNEEAEVRSYAVKISHEEKGRMDPFEGGYTFESIKLYDPVKEEMFDGWTYICYKHEEF